MWHNWAPHNKCFFCVVNYHSRIGSRGLPVPNWYLATGIKFWRPLQNTRRCQSLQINGQKVCGSGLCRQGCRSTNQCKGGEFANSLILLVVWDMWKRRKMHCSLNADGPYWKRFNGRFIKKCWPIIKSDFQRLFRDFYDNAIDLTSINSSFIALVPKKSNPETVDDFRPISLLNYSIKSITKLLS